MGLGMMTAVTALTGSLVMSGRLGNGCATISVPNGRSIRL